MSDEASEEERFVVLQGPAGMTEEEYGRLAEAVEATLPDDMSALIMRGEISTLSRSELVNVLEQAMEEALHGHRLEGAEPAEQPADPPWEDEDVEDFREAMSEEDNE